MMVEGSGTAVGVVVSKLAVTMPPTPSIPEMLTLLTTRSKVTDSPGDAVAKLVKFEITIWEIDAFVANEVTSWSPR
jgi:hypothetical protein